MHLEIYGSDMLVFLYLFLDLFEPSTESFVGAAASDGQRLLLWDTQFLAEQRSFPMRYVMQGCGLTRLVIMAPPIITTGGHRYTKMNFPR